MGPGSKEVTRPEQQALYLSSTLPKELLRERQTLSQQPMYKYIKVNSTLTHTMFTF